MTFNLGIDIGDDRVTAAYERSGTMRLVSFGRVRATPLRVHIATTGDVSVGRDAVHAASADPGGEVTDVAARFGESKSAVVNGYAVTGETILAHVVSFVIDQAEAQADVGPVGRVAIAHPVSWTASMRAALSGALAQIGLADAEVVMQGQAATQAPESARNLPEQAPALGAAVLAARRARSAGPGARPARASSTRPTRPIPTDAPTSVFDPTDPSSGHGSAAGAAAGGSALGGGSRGAAAGPGAGGSGSGPPRNVPPLGEPSDGDGSPPWSFIAAGVALLALVILLAVVVLNRGDGDSTVQSTGPTGPTGSTTTASSTTTSTTEVPATSTSTTSTTTTSTTTTTVPVTTTTAPPREIGQVALSEVGLILDFGTEDSTTVLFGDDADDALSAIRARAGVITDDTGWTHNSFCTGAMTRRVHFGDLEVVFTADDDENETFEQWFVDTPGRNPAGLVTLDRVGVGTTLADLRRIYGDSLRVTQPSNDADEGLFTTSQTDEFIDGVLSGVEETSQIEQIWSGSACQRVPD